MRKATLAVCLVAASLLPAAPTAQARCADVKVGLRNLKLVAKWQHPEVRVGDTAVLKVHVSRTAEEDPITEEEPWPTGRPMKEPVEDVEIGLGLYVGNVYLNGGALSNAAGKAEIPVEVRSYTKPGTGTTSLYGELRHTPRDFPSPSCRVVIYEWGALEPGPKLRVVR